MREIRQARIGDEMRRVLAAAISRQLKDPRVPAMTSVTAVKVSGDLALAKCYISVLGTDEEKQDCIRALKKAEGFLRGEIARGMKIRAVPELSFILDNTVDEAMRIDRLIDEAMGRS